MKVAQINVTVEFDPDAYRKEFSDIGSSDQDIADDIAAMIRLGLRGDYSITKMWRGYRVTGAIKTEATVP